MGWGAGANEGWLAWFSALDRGSGPVRARDGDGRGGGMFSV